MCKSGGAPAPDPNIGKAALASAELGKEALDFYKTIYESDIRPAQERDMALREGLVQDFMDTSAQQRQFAEEQRDFYKDTFQDVERRTVADAMDYDSDENVRRRMGLAASAQTSAASNAAQQRDRQLAAYGINPSSGAFARANNQAAIAGGVASAAAQTGAAFDTMDRGIALRSGVANFGRNMPNTAAQYFSQAGAAGSGAANISAQGMQGIGANAGVMGQGFNTAMQGFGQQGNLALGGYNAQMQGYMADQQRLGSMYQGIGTFAGMMMKPAADGGLVKDIEPVPKKKPRRGVRSKQDYAKKGKKIHQGAGLVRGPGGPVDDKVPAMLSNKEYVLPADTTEAVGKETLDAIVAQTHTPAAVQRGLSRSA
jgi:hypothetical protein